HLLDLEHAPEMPNGIDQLGKLQLHVGWLEETGQWQGVSRRHFKLDPPLEGLRLKVEGGEVVAAARDAAMRIPRVGPVLSGGSHLDERPWHVARPGNLVTWAVDRV